MLLMLILGVLFSRNLRYKLCLPTPFGNLRSEQSPAWEIWPKKTPGFALPELRRNRSKDSGSNLIFVRPSIGHTVDNVSKTFSPLWIWCFWKGGKRTLLRMSNLLHVILKSPSSASLQEKWPEKIDSTSHAVDSIMKNPIYEYSNWLSFCYHPHWKSSCHSYSNHNLTSNSPTNIAGSKIGPWMELMYFLLKERWGFIAIYWVLPIPTGSQRSSKILSQSRLFSTVK